MALSLARWVGLCSLSEGWAGRGWSQPAAGPLHSSIYPVIICCYAVRQSISRCARPGRRSLPTR